MSWFNNRKDLVPKVSVETNFKYISSQKELNKHFDSLMSLPYWIADTETTGVDPHTNQVVLLQLGNKEVQYLIDTRQVSVDRLKEKFEDESFKKIFQNAIFDYKMMQGSLGITMEGIRCTMLAEMILVCGVQKFGFGLADLAMKYLHVALDKQMQTSFINHHGPFSHKQLVYAAMDCVVPDHILAEQFRVLERENLISTWILECNSIPSFGDMEFYGLLLDEKAWMKNVAEEETCMHKAIGEFLSLAAPYVSTDLYGNPDINPNSPAQILSLLQTIYGEEEVVDSDGKKGTGDEVLTKLVNKFSKNEVIKSLQSIREHAKKISTYGRSYTQAIHPLTKRLHPRISQIGTDTGRPAGKKPNMLNIPSSPRYRTPWIAGPGRKILTNDYGACELRIMASMSKDPVMCRGFNDGLDYHTFTAAEFVTDNEDFERVFIPHPKGEEGKGTLGDFVFNQDGSKVPNPHKGKVVPYAKVLKSQRGVAKTINFGLAYGMGAAKLGRTLGILLTLSRTYVSQFNTRFAVLVGWLRDNQMIATQPRSCSYSEYESAKAEKRSPKLTLGYSETFLGRRRYFKLPVAPGPVVNAPRYSKVFTGKFKEIENRFFDKTVEEDDKNSKVKVVPINRWEAPGLPTLKYDPKNPWDDNMPETIRKYYQRTAGIQREGGNSPIQGSNADITKLAMYKLRKWIKKVERERNNGEYLLHIGLQVYDELVVDCPEHMSKEVAEAMDRYMIEAGEEVIKAIPVETGCIIADSWIKG